VRFKSINSLLSTIVGLLVVMTFAALILYVSSSSYRGILEAQSQSMRQINANLVQMVDDVTNQGLGVAQTVAQQKAVINALKMKNEAIVDLARNQIKKNIVNFPIVESIVLFDGSGSVIAGVRHDLSGFRDKDVSGSALFADTVENKTAHTGSTITKGLASDQLVFYTGAPVKKTFSDEVLGGVGIAINWSLFSSKSIEPITVGRHGYPFMIDQDGDIIAHPDPDKLLQPSSSFETIKPHIGTETSMVHYEYKGEDKILTFQVYPRNDWIICMSAYQKDLAAQAIQQRNTLAFMGVLAIAVLILILVLFMNRTIFKPIRTIREFTRKVTQGDFDASLDGRFVYELKSLARDVSTMVGDLKSKLAFSQGILESLTIPCVVANHKEEIVFVNQQAVDLLELDRSPRDLCGMSVGEFFYNDPERKTIIGKAIAAGEPILNVEVEGVSRKGSEFSIRVDAAPITDQEGNFLAAFVLYTVLTEIKRQQQHIEAQNERIESAASRASSISDQLSSASEELSTRIEEASQGADEQKNRAAEASTAMEEMNATVLEVAKNASYASEIAENTKSKAQDGTEVVQQTVEVMNLVQEKVAKLKGDMSELGSQADGIGEIMNVITDIADQTNLLALNAAIEAARAGDAGRGFAVVADEVRKLAEKTMNATREVGESITAIQGSARNNIANTEEAARAVTESNDLSQKSGRFLQEILSLVEESADQIRNIATSSEQQSSASEEINQATEDVSRIASETADAMTQASQAVQELSTVAHELQAVIKAVQD